MSQDHSDSLLSKRMTRSEFLKLCGAATATMAISALSPLGNVSQANVSQAKEKEAADNKVLKIGYIPITDAAPLLIAHAKGFYAKHGIKADRPVLIRGWSTISEAFTAGKFNLVHLLLPIPIYMRYNRGFGVKVVAWDHLNNSAITVGEKSGISSLSDLGGKTIAVPYWYSMHNIILQLCLKKHGIEVVTKKSSQLASNQTYVLVMEPPDMPTAMVNKAIDGYIVAEPFNAVGELLAHGKILRFTGDIWQNHPCCVAVMHEQDVINHRPWSQKVVLAMVEAQEWLKNNKEEAAKILSRDGENYLPLPHKVLRQAMIEYSWGQYGTEGGTGAIVHKDWHVGRIGFQPYPFRSATEKTVEMMKQVKLEGDMSFLQKVSGSQVADELVDYEFVRNAIKTVGGMEKFDGFMATQDPYKREEIIAI